MIHEGVSLRTCAIFRDLVDAFNTISHELLFKILAEVGVPPKLTEAAWKMHMNYTVGIEVGTEK